MKRRNEVLILCATIATLFAETALPDIPAGVIQNYPKAEPTVKCYEVNSCKGKAACETALNSCAGQNSCKGKGFLEVTAKVCKDKHGKLKDPFKKKKSSS